MLDCAGWKTLLWGDLCIDKVVLEYFANFSFLILDNLVHIDYQSEITTNLIRLSPLMIELIHSKLWLHRLLGYRLILLIDRARSGSFLIVYR